MCLKIGLMYVIFHVINNKYWFLGFIYEVRSDKFPVAIVYNIADRCFLFIFDYISLRHYRNEFISSQMKMMSIMQKLLCTDEADLMNFCRETD